MESEKFSSYPQICFSAISQKVLGLLVVSEAGYLLFSTLMRGLCLQLLLAVWYNYFCL